MNAPVPFPLVITTAFSPRSDVPSLAIKKGDVRTRETLYAIVWWLCKSHFDKFVVVDTTGYEFLSESLTNLAWCSGKTLEYLAIKNDDESVARYGKGFGEGFALDIAVHRSILLAGYEGFFKCTGKVIIENYLECVKQAELREFYFEIPRGTMRFVDTRFYFVSKSFWVDNLRSAYKNVNETAGIYLEHAYFDAITKVSPIPYNPIVVKYRGISGSFGDVYEESSIVYRTRVLWRRSYALFDKMRSKFNRPIPR